ncbi:MAG: MCE family protein [Bacteroidales bacterium]|nr:MCE family protein [Bacteroidales bacterium]
MGIKLRKETKIGLSVTAAFIMLFWGINFLKGRNLFSGTDIYYALYHKVDGLTVSANVQINGFKIGHVVGIELIKNKSNMLLVSFEVSDEYQIPMNSIAEIYSLDFIGTKAINIKIPASYNSFYQPSDTLISVYDEGFSEIINQIKRKAEHAIISLDSLLHNINTLLDHKTRSLFSQTVNNLAQITSNVNQQFAPDGAAAQTMQHVEAITAELSLHTRSMGRAIENIETVTDSLTQWQVGQTLVSLDSALLATHLLLNNINQGQAPWDNWLRTTRYSKPSSIYR